MSTTLPLPPEHHGKGRAAASGTVPVAGLAADLAATAADESSGPPTTDTGDAAALKARAQRLHYLFRRSLQPPHVLQKALFIYREVPLP